MSVSTTGTSVRTERYLPVVLFSLLIVSTFIGFSPIIVGEPRAGFAEEEGNSIRQLVFTLLFASIALTTAYRGKMTDLLNVPLPLVALLTWCWLSVVWAIEPGVAVRRVLFTTMIVLSVTYSVNQLTPRAAMRTLTIWFGVILLLDWGAVLLTAKGVHPPDELDAALVGNWRGIHSHKNEAGPFCAIVALIFTDMIGRRRSYITAPIMLALALVFLLMTASKTSFGLVFVAGGLGVLVVSCYNNPDLRKVVLVAGFCLLFVVALAADSESRALLAWFDDPRSLTGRVQIWPVLLDYASDHLLLGSGYGSFWAIGNSSPIFERTSSWVTIIRHAHNGYIDLLIQTGLVGLLLAIVILIAHPAYLLFTRRILSPPSRWLIGAILIFCWLHDFLETSLMDRAHPLWVIMLIIYNLLLRQSARVGSTKLGFAGNPVTQVSSSDTNDQT